MSDAILDLPASPWTGRANTAAALATLASLVVVVVGWEGVSNQATLDDAQPWFLVGVIGLLVGLATAVLWLNSAAKRIRGVRLDCHSVLRSGYGMGSESPTISDATLGPTRYVRVRGVAKVHLDTCELVSGKAYDELPNVPVGADRCGVCNP